MTEEKVGHLYKSAATLDAHKYAIFKSSYLMKCYEITGGYGLPKKHFAAEKICSHCFVSWSSGMFETKVKPLNEKQKRKIKSAKHVKKHLLHSTQLERKCLFCNSTTIIRCPKTPPVIRTRGKRHSKPKISLKHNRKRIQIPPQSSSINIYTKSKDIFSLQNKKNTITKPVPKIIKNNKRRKDKYAGLCKAAVLASEKIKQLREQESTTKLNLFLKPSK